MAEPYQKRYASDMDHSRRTYEPLKFLGRLFWVPLPTEPKTPPVSRTSTWENNGERWAPTVVVRIPFTRKAIGLGVWLDAPQDVMMVHEADAAYDAYQVVNGQVDRAEFDRIREHVAGMGLDPDAEMEMMQGMGLFE